MKLPNSILNDPELTRGFTLRRSAAALIIGVVLAVLLVVAATSGGHEAAAVAADLSEPPIIFPEALPEPPVAYADEPAPACAPARRVQGLFGRPTGRTGGSGEAFLESPRPRIAGGPERTC